MNDNGATRTFQTARCQELIYELKVEQAMIRNVITVEMDDSMEKLRQILKDHRISGVPVTRDGALVGVVSIDGLIRSLLEGKIEEPVKNWMSEGVVTLFADEPLVHAVQKFDLTGFGRFPVMERKSGAMVGILT